MIVTLSYSLIKDLSKVDLQQRTTIALGLGVVAYGILIYQLSGRDKMVNVSVIGLAVVDFLVATYEFYKDSCKESETVSSSSKTSSSSTKTRDYESTDDSPQNSDSSLTDDDTDDSEEETTDEEDDDDVTDDADGVFGSEQLTDQEKDEIMKEIRTIDPVASEIIEQLNADVHISLESEQPTVVIPLNQETIVEVDDDEDDEAIEADQERAIEGAKDLSEAESAI